ncbi:hypothetical protein V6N13_045689 [Hibiscus sabdariffa]
MAMVPMSTQCSMKEVNRGAWTAEEDNKLAQVIEIHGPKRWKTIAAKAGLKRCGKSCRLRWMNYLRPNINRGNISDQEEDLILRLHKLLGNRWSLIAGRLPGRTDNQIKNYWNSHLSKKIKLNENQNKSSKVQETMLGNSKETEMIFVSTGSEEDVTTFRFLDSVDNAVMETIDPESPRHARILEQSRKFFSLLFYALIGSTGDAPSDRGPRMPDAIRHPTNNTASLDPTGTSSVIQDHELISHEAINVGSKYSRNEQQ